MPAILANTFVYNLQRIKGTILISDLSVPFIYQFVDEKTLTALFQFPTCYSTPLSFLLQTVVLYLILYSLVIHITSTHCSWTILPVFLPMFFLWLPKNALFWLQTTRIASFPAANGNFVIKSIIRCVHSFSGTLLIFNFPTGISVLFFIL